MEQKQQEKEVSNDVVSTVSFLMADPIGRLTALVLGFFLCVVCYEYFVLVAKDAEIKSKDELIKVKQERLLKKNDVIDALKIELSYKPSKDKRIIEELTSKNETLTQQNEALKLLEKAQDANKSVVDEYQELLAKSNVLIKTNEQLTFKLSKYESIVLVESLSVPVGEAWVGFGGAVTFGVHSVSVNDTANASLSVDGSGQSIPATSGLQIPFEINGARYIISIESISYVGQRVEMSVSKSKT